MATTKMPRTGPIVEPVRVIDVRQTFGDQWREANNTVPEPMSTAHEREEMRRADSRSEHPSRCEHARRH